MRGNQRRESLKKLYELTLRYDKNQIIHSNPDAVNKPEVELLLEKVPELVHLMLHGKSKERIHAVFGLKNLSDEKRLRLPLCMAQDFIESICTVLIMEPNNTDSTQRRCQQHALAILNNLLLEDPVMDSFIVNDEHMLPGLAKQLLSNDTFIQELSAKCLDYISVTLENQTLVCSSDGILPGLVYLMSHTRSIEVRRHILQALVYLSSNVKNKFLITRADGMMDVLKNCLTIKDRLIVRMTIQILYNLCLLKENIPQVARHNELRIAITANHSELLEQLNGLLEEEEDEKKEFNDQLHSEKSTMKLAGVILNMLYAYDARMNSKVILRGEGFNSPSIAIGKHISQSMIGGIASSPTHPFTPLLRNSGDDDTFFEANNKSSSHSTDNNRVHQMIEKSPNRNTIIVDYRRAQLLMDQKGLKTTTTTRNNALVQQEQLNSPFTPHSY